MNRFSFLLILMMTLACSLAASRVWGIERAEFPNFHPSLAIEKQQPELQNIDRDARQLYESGQYEKAIQLLQEAIANAKAKGDIVGQAIALRNLALAYLKTGNFSQANLAIEESFDLIQRREMSRESQHLLAQILEVQGQLELVEGNSEAALKTWQQAAENYSEIGDVLGATRNQINQAQALQAMGLYYRATKNLLELQNNLARQPDTLLKAQALQSLGDVFRAVGQLEDSEAVLQESLAIAEQGQAPDAIASILISLGNTARIQPSPKPEPERIRQAFDYYRLAAAQSLSPELQIQAQLYQFNLSIDQGQFSDSLTLLPQIQSTLAQLSPSRAAIYARIHFARSLMKLPAEKVPPKQVADTLAAALQTARTLGDKRAEAYALGSLGKLYEQNQRWEEAQEATEKALAIAQTVHAPDIAYQWQWQLGRILKVRGDQESAISAYSQSVKTLQALRSDLVAISSEVQFSFRESVEPVYRELVDLLLQPDATQEHLQQAREAIEALQLAELDNFFRDACLDTQNVQIDRLDSHSAIFYTIILRDRGSSLEGRDRLEVILALPGHPLRHYATHLAKEEVETTLKELRTSLASYRTTGSRKRLEKSQTVYNWLIRPIEKELQANQIETLVFVSDGLLRNIPIAALYDGEQYVIQKYSVAIAPTLNLIDPQPLARASLQVLAAGLTEARQGLPSLPNVAFELESIETEVPTQILLNQAFTEANFKATVSASDFPIVHLATHGEFSSKAQNTFLLAWDEKINIEELNALLRTDLQQTQPIELLVLSACRTAFGDERAVLGLAGVALRAGARSTLASLWYVSDEATSLLMDRFYHELTNSSITKAEALRRAQVAILQNEKFSHPYFWSAFVLVGNWL